MTIKEVSYINNTIPIRTRLDCLKKRIGPLHAVFSFVLHASHSHHPLCTYIKHTRVLTRIPKKKKKEKRLCPPHCVVSRPYPHYYHSHAFALNEHMSATASSPHVPAKKRYADKVSQTATARGRRSASPGTTPSTPRTPPLQPAWYMTQQQQQQQQAYYPWFFYSPPPPPLAPYHNQPPQYPQHLPHYPQPMMMWAPPSLPHRQSSRPAPAPSSPPPLSTSCFPAPPPSPPASSGRRSPRQKLHMDLTENDQDDTIPLAMLAHKLHSPPPSPAASVPHAKQSARRRPGPGSVSSHGSRPASRNKMMPSPGGSRPSSPSHSYGARSHAYGRAHPPSAPPPPIPPPNLTPVARSASVPTRETKHTSCSSDTSEKGSEKKPSSIMSKAKRFFGIRRRTSAPT